MSLKSELIRIRKLKEDINCQIDILKKQLCDADREISKIMARQKEAENPTISDHALVRYLERAKGFDLDMFRDEILTKDRISAINSGAQAINVDGLKFKVANKVVVTVI